MGRKLRLPFMLLLGILIHSYGQVKNIGLPKIINYKKSDYSGGSQNWDIGQDRAGNMYFANTAGLLQFNGTSWSKSLMPNGTVRALKVCSDGKIYVGGYNEFGYFEPDQNGKMLYHSISKLIPADSKKIIDFVWRVHSIGKAIYFQTFFCTYRYESGKLTMIDAPNRFKFSFSVNKTLYLQDINLGILVYRNGKLLPLPDTQQLNRTEIWGMLPFGGDKLMIITNDKGIFIYDRGKCMSWQCEANEFVKKNNSLGGHLIGRDYIVLNSVQDGVVLCDKSGRIVQHIHNGNGLQNSTALSSFVDSSQNVWIGLDNGISYLNENSPFTFLGSTFGFSSVYASVEYGGTLYVATNKGLFSHAWNDPFWEESFHFVEGTTGQAWDVQNVDGSLFCSHNRGLYLLEKGHAPVLLDDAKGYLTIKRIPGQPRFLVAANYQGFAILEKTPGGWKYRNQLEGFSVSDNKFVTDGSYIWLKKNDTFRLKLGDDLKNFTEIKTYKRLSHDVDGITSIQELGHQIYFQSQNRFFTFDKQRGQFTEDRKVSSIFSKLPKIRYCFEDRLGNICYFIHESSMGMLVKQSDGSFKNVSAPFSALTGNLVYFFESVNTINKSNVFIGITEGLAHYDPSRKAGVSTRPKAYISQFMFGGDTLVPAGIPRLGDIRIPFRDNKVKFAFSSPIYDNPENARFSYRLDGFDSSWSGWGRAAVKEYTYLHEGNYTMQLRVMDCYGNISDVSSVQFRILPPFYRHWLAYVLYMLLACCVLYFLRWRVKVKIQLGRHKEALEQQRLYLEKETKIRQEQLELEKEIERLKNEQLQMEILVRDKQLVNNSLESVKKDKMLNNITSKLKDIDASMPNAKASLIKLTKTIDKGLNADKSWNDLEKHIRNEHFDFRKRLKEQHPAVTPREMDLATYLLMNMSSKEIADIMNISDGSVELARHRLRKKLGLERKDNLISVLMGI